MLITINILAKPNDKITLQLDWLHQFQFAGYYMAREKGYYTDLNLDVMIREFNNKTNLVNKVLENKNTYGIGKSSLIIDKLNQKDIVILSAIYQNSPLVLLTLKSSNINTVKDLINKKVMLTSDARETVNIISMIRSKNINIKDIDFLPHSFNIEDLINGNVDAMGSYLSNEPYILNEKNIEFNILNPKDYGFNFYGGLLFTSNQELEDNPLRTKNFYKSSLKGWSYAFNNIEETAQLIYDKYNSQNKSLESLIFEGKVLKKLAVQSKNKIGHIDLKKIEEMTRLYSIMGFNKKVIKLPDDFIFNNKASYYTSEEIEFIKNNSISLITKPNNTPFSFKKDDIIEGIEIELLKLITNKLPIKYNIIEEHSNHKIIIKNIKTNSIHIKYQYKQNSNTSNRLSSNTITKIPIVIATSINKNIITDLNSFENIKVAVLKDNELLYKLQKAYPQINFFKLDSIDTAFSLLDSNKIFGIIDNILSLSHAIINNKYSNVKISGTLPFNLELKLSTDSNNSILIRLFNKSIKNISIKEKNKILQKYQLTILKEISDYSWIYKFVLPLISMLLIIIFFNTKMRKEISKRKIAEKELTEFASKDSLTKIFNRGKIENLLNKEIGNSNHQDDIFSIIFFDIDNFKQLNDKFGHNKGDEVLIELSRIISINIRDSDYFGRWGGEEFIIILPKTTSNQAFLIANNLKLLIINYDFNINNKITISSGITQYINSDSTDTIITRADSAMYYVKEHGKNSISIL
jgi:polar amino acid transport system substrate-binding protein